MLRLATKGQKSRKIGITPRANGLRCQLAPEAPDLYRNIRTYSCRCAVEEHYRYAMWKTMRTNSIAVTVVAIWFTVVTLGFGSYVWPLLVSVP